MQKLTIFQNYYQIHILLANYFKKTVIIEFMLKKMELIF